MKIRNSLNYIINGILVLFMVCGCSSKILKEKRNLFMTLVYSDPCQQENVASCKESCRVIANMGPYAIQFTLDAAAEGSFTLLSQLNTGLCAGQYPTILNCYLVTLGTNACTEIEDILQNNNPISDIFTNPVCQCNQLLSS